MFVWQRKLYCINTYACIHFPACFVTTLKSSFISPPNMCARWCQSVWHQTLSDTNMCASQFKTRFLTRGCKIIISPTVPPCGTGVTLQLFSDSWLSPHTLWRAAGMSPVSELLNEGLARRAEADVQRRAPWLNFFGWDGWSLSSSTPRSLSPLLIERPDWP